MCYRIRCSDGHLLSRPHLPTVSTFYLRLAPPLISRHFKSKADALFDININVSSVHALNMNVQFLGVSGGAAIPFAASEPQMTPESPGRRRHSWQTQRCPSLILPGMKEVKLSREFCLQSGEAHCQTMIIRCLRRQ